MIKSISEEQAKKWENEREKYLSRGKSLSSLPGMLACLIIVVCAILSHQKIIDQDTSAIIVIPSAILAWLFSYGILFVTVSNCLSREKLIRRYKEEKGWLKENGG